MEYLCHCDNCGYDWRPYKHAARPAVCANCHSATWDQPGHVRTPVKHVGFSGEEDLPEGAAWFALTDGTLCMVDAEDVPRLLERKWYRTRHGYGAAHFRIGGKRILIGMHRYLLDPAREYEVDHINRNRLDNRKANLREATRSQNGVNRQCAKDAIRGVRGVYPNPSARYPWTAIISVEGKKNRLGSFRTVEEAARAYDKAAEKAFGELARLNFPKPRKQPPMVLQPALPF